VLHLKDYGVKTMRADVDTAEVEPTRREGVLLAVLRGNMALSVSPHGRVEVEHDAVALLAEFLADESGKLRAGQSM
jgi:hypothetical protein